MTRAALLVLADGRFPAGGHAHSGGVEAAVASGAVHDTASLEAFCRGRLHTAGLTAAALTAAAADGHDPLVLDEAADARTPMPALRKVARRLGRQMLRPQGVHQPVVLGVAARAACLTPLDAAQAAAYESVGGPATATVRLLSLDPFEATALLARLAPEMDDVADAAVTAAGRLTDLGIDALPAASAPLLDLTGEQHAAWTVRLFAS
jgi:urease accessory protein